MPYQCVHGPTHVNTPACIYQQLLRRAARLRPLESQHTLHVLAALQAVQVDWCTHRGMQTAHVSTKDIDGGAAAVQEWLQQATANCAAPWTTAQLLCLLRDVRGHQPSPLLGYYATPGMQGWGQDQHTAAGALPSVRFAQCEISLKVAANQHMQQMGNVQHWAVVFSLARLLFVSGHLAAVQSLVDMGAALSTPLPNPGLYRNEAAYFTCICKV